MEKEGPERKILKEIMAKKCPSPVDTYKPTDPRSPVKSSIGNMRITPRHHCQTAQSQWCRENCRISQRGKKMLYMYIRLFTGTLQTKKKKRRIFYVLKEKKNLLTRVHAQQYPFKNESKIKKKTFSLIWNLGLTKGMKKKSKTIPIC